MDGITIVCLNWGNYCGRGADYVNNLFDMVTRHLPDGPFKFQCFTDNTDGLEPRIETRALSGNIRGWWNKLYLFKKGLFPDGETVLFLDLDTLITGPLDDIVKYTGDFAILRDFYHPKRYGPGVMLWKAGEHSRIWESYEAAGCPTDLPLGDLSWINKCFSEWNYKPDILQDIFPAQVCSYKVHAKNGVPEGANIVCFHGLPRPHEVEGWVADVWKIGGYTRFFAASEMNTAHAKVWANVVHSSSLDLPWIKTENDHDGVALIIGGAPSLSDDLEEIRLRQQNGHKIFATNGTYSFLKKNGIIPDYAVVIDARPENAAFLYDATKGTRYLLASQCAPATFAVVDGLDVVLMHMNYGDRTVEDMLPKNEKTSTVTSVVIGGGNTVGLIAMSIAKALGFNNLHIFGMDSSFREDAHHAYNQVLNETDETIEVEAAGRKFNCAPWMIQQAEQFQELASILANNDCTITVHGDGLLPHIAHVMSTIEEKAA